jgi:hypothetical protein
MNWTSIIEGTAAGVAASIVLGLAAYCYSFARNRILRKAVERTLTSFSSGQSVFGVTVGISNHTQRPIIIRSVSFNGAKARYRLNPEGETSTLSVDRKRKLTAAELKELQSGKMVQISQEVGFTHSWREKPPASGFVEITPYTTHHFVLRAELLVDFNDRIDGVIVVAEYTAWNGVIELVEGKIVDGMDALNTTLEHYTGQIKTGSLNKARAMFGAPQLKPTQNSRPTGG